MKWPEYNLKEIADVIMGHSPPGKTYNEEGNGLPFFQGKAEFGHIYPVIKKWCSAPSRVARQGDILLSVRAPVGPTNLAPCECCIGRGLAAIRARENVTEQKYLWFFFKHLEPILSRRGQGSTFTAINRSEINNILVPLPPLSEQRRIVEILDQADALRKKRAEADTKAVRIIPALFYKMFGDPATNPKGWPVKTLGELSIGRPQYGANAKAIDYKPGAPRYVRITDLTDDGRLSNADIKTLDLDDWEAYRLVEGDLLFARSGATVGKTYLYQPEDGLCAYAGYLIRFKLDTTAIDPWVVFAFTQTPYYHSWVESKRRTAAQPNINGQEYASLRLPLPDRQTQQRFICAAREFRALHAKREQIANRIENLFFLLLHRAFTGDLTAQWREAHMKELLEEMEKQANALTISGVIP